MLKTIIYRVFLANIITFRFLLGLLVCIGLVVTNTYVLVQNYEEKLQGYHLAVQQNTDGVRKIQVYSELSTVGRTKADKEPRLTSILNEGVTGRVGDSAEVAHSIVPVMATKRGSDNPYLAVFSRIDLTFIFQIVMSLLAFLFAYDSVAGEQETGTLRLVLSNPVPRGILLLGKYLGGMLSLTVPLVLNLLIALQIILFSPNVMISASDWIRIGLFCLVSLIYVSVFFTLGMLFSSNTKRSATALMITMFFWVAFVLVWPSASTFAVSKLVPIKSDADLTLEGAIAAIAKGKISQNWLGDLWFNQFNHEIDKFLKQHDILLSFNGSYSNWLEGESFSGKYTGPSEKLLLFHEYFKFRNELRIQYGDKTGKMRWEYLNKYPIRQAKLARNIGRISPAVAYADATAILAETDLDTHLRFLDQAKQYRNELIQYLRDQNAFASDAWYDPDAGKKIDKDGIPLFHERPESLSSSIKRASVDILILVLLNIAFFLLTYLSFIRYNLK